MNKAKIRAEIVNKLADLINSYPDGEERDYAEELVFLISATEVNLRSPETIEKVIAAIRRSL